MVASAGGTYGVGRAAPVFQQRSALLSGFISCYQRDDTRRVIMLYVSVICDL